MDRDRDVGLRWTLRATYFSAFRVTRSTSSVGSMWTRREAMRRTVTVELESDVFVGAEVTACPTASVRSLVWLPDVCYVEFLRQRVVFDIPTAARAHTHTHTHTHTNQSINQLFACKNAQKHVRMQIKFKQRISMYITGPTIAKYRSFPSAISYPLSSPRSLPLLCPPFMCPRVHFRFPHFLFLPSSLAI